MNALLQNRYNELGKEEIFLLRDRLSDSPRALLLFDFLEKRKGKKINAIDAVEFIYKEENEKFETLRNRFFKLRKQVIELLGETGKTSTSNGMILLPLEEKLYRCRQMISENHFQLAKNELRQLIQECRRLNIFEILPEAIGQLVYCNMAMNVLKENDRLLTELMEASNLLNDLRQAQTLSRKIYMLVLSRSYVRLPEILRKIRRLAIMRSGFPRFRIFYHFTVVGYTVGVPAFSSKAHARHITSLKKLMEKNPGMPAGYYEPNGSAIMQFYLLIADGTHLYMKGDVANSYNHFKEGWEIMERTPNLRIRKSESFFSNRIAIEVATGRYREALKTAEDLIEFQKEQRQEEKRLKGFADMAMIYTYAYPVLKCPNPDFLISQLKTYISLLKKNDSSALGDGLSTQAIFHFLCGDFKTTKKIMANENAKEIFVKMNLKIYLDLLDLSPVSSQEKIQQVKKEMERLIHNAVSSDVVFSLKRAQVLLKFLEDHIRSTNHASKKVD
jgi:hypothetical protein